MLLKISIEFVLIFLFSGMSIAYQVYPSISHPNGIEEGGSVYLNCKASSKYET